MVKSADHKNTKISFDVHNVACTASHFLLTLSNSNEKLNQTGKQGSFNVLISFLRSVSSLLQSESSWKHVEGISGFHCHNICTK